MNYTLHQLQVFLQVVKTKSVTLAAGELNLTQPAVSIQLKKFQDQFDIPLTEVIGRKIYITDFGHEIAEAAEQIVNQVHAINYKTLAYKGQLAGRLRLSVVSTGKYVMPYFISDFINKHKGIDLNMDVTNKHQVTESLVANEVDFSLVSIIPANLDVGQLDLLPNKLHLIGNSRQQVQQTRNINTLFEKLPLIFREEGSGTRKTMEEFIHAKQIAVNKRLELTSNEAVKQAVLAGLGFSIMPLIGIKNELKNKELQIIPVKGLPIQTTWSLIWPKAKKHSPLALALLNHIHDERDRIIKEHFQWVEQI